MERAKEIEKELASMDVWDTELLEELCILADMESEWKESDGDNFEQIAYKAAKKLGIEI